MTMTKRERGGRDAARRQFLVGKNRKPNFDTTLDRGVVAGDCHTAAADVDAFTITPAAVIKA
jgi:hypothetical protein